MSGGFVIRPNERCDVEEEGLSARRETRCHVHRAHTGAKGGGCQGSPIGVATRRIRRFAACARCAITSG